jgi:hypothetical protein
VLAMQAVKLETELLRVRKDLQGVKQVNDKFCNILDEINKIKIKSNADPKVREQISAEFKEREIVDIFASIENDFRELRNQLSKQEIYKERVADFVESLRTRRSFSFDSATDTILFLEEALAEVDAQIISIKPEFVGTIDLGEIALEIGLHKTGTAIIVQKELLSEVLSLMVNKRMFRNIIFETSNTKLFVKSSTQIIAESNNTNIRKISHLRD